MGPPNRPNAQPSILELIKLGPPCMLFCGHFQFHGILLFVYVDFAVISNFTPHCNVKLNFKLSIDTNGVFWNRSDPSGLR